jgi:hypothetical protein
MTAPNPYAKQWAQFKASTADHVLIVLRDDGLYRHFRMGKPGTGMWSWNVVTWPWHLYVGGDIGGGFVWSREEDMVAFMDTRHYGDYHGDGSPLLQADYWAEKLDHVCRDRAYSFSEDRFIRRVTEAVEGWPAADALVSEAREAAYYEAEAREWLSEHQDGFPDSWEWELKDLDHHYLLACYAVVTTIAAVRRMKEAAA